MKTGNRSKTGLSVVSLALLAGVSAAALSLGISSVEAQSITANGVPLGVLPLNTVNGTLTAGFFPVTGLTFNGGSGTTTTIDQNGLFSIKPLNGATTISGGNIT